MCPLRIILLFLSATLAGFLVLNNLFKSHHHHFDVDDDDNTPLPDPPTPTHSSSSSSPPPPPSTKDKVMSAIGWAFWTFLDMASGRYLWRHLAPPPAPNRSD